MEVVRDYGISIYIKEIAGQSLLRSKADPE
jgi:hypothetical protein